LSSLIGSRDELDFPTVIRLPDLTLDFFIHFSDRRHAVMSLYVAKSGVRTED
jgi:hypothetical protein